MNKKEPESKKALAVISLPICIALGISFGSFIGTAAGNISMGICIGIIAGAAAGMISFGILFALLNKDKK